MQAIVRTLPQHHSTYQALHKKCVLVGSPPEATCHFLNFCEQGGPG